MPSVTYNRGLISQYKRSLSKKSKIPRRRVRSQPKPDAPERKVQDTFYNGTVGTAGAITLFNGLVQGLDNVNRIGRQVTNKSIYQRMTINVGAGAAANQNLRLMLMWVKDPSQTAPTLTTVFGTATPGVNQMMNLNYRNDYVVLLDKTYTLSPLSGGPSCRFDKIYKKCNMKTIYNANNTGGISDIEAGALYIVLLSDVAIAGNGPNVTIQSRVRFVDN